MEDSFVLNGPAPFFKLPEQLCMGELLYKQLLAHGKKVSQIQREIGEQLNFEQVLDKSRKLAIYMKNNKIQVNDRIAICSENNLNFVIPVCATIFVGATMCPVNPIYTKNEFKHTLNISKPKFIFVSPLSLESIRQVVKELSWSVTIILLYGNSIENIPSLEEIITNIPYSSIQNFKVTKVDGNEHVMGILCSSGTTGLPKGVMLSANNYLITLQNMLDPRTNFISKDQTLLYLLPLFHAYCFATLIIGLVIGSTGVLLSHFEEEEFLSTIQDYKIEILTLVPPLMVFLAKQSIVQKYDLSCVKTIWCGAAPLSPDIEHAVKSRLKNAQMRQGYGMTELTFCTTCVPPGTERPGSAGKLMSGISAKIVQVDENGQWSDKNLGPNQEGELCFKGDTVMLGYCNNKEATEATIDKDGWLHSGDIGYYDKDEFFYIVDRLKELIKYKGYQVPPAELETILLTHPQIKDAAVIGLPDEQAGELPCAFVVKQIGAKITDKDVMKYVAEQVSNYKRLRGGVRFIESIPKNPSGKILRRQLRDLLKSKL